MREETIEVLTRMRADVPDVNGNIFTRACVERLAAQMPGRVVTRVVGSAMLSDAVGTVQSATLSDDGRISIVIRSIDDELRRMLDSGRWIGTVTMAESGIVEDARLVSVCLYPPDQEEIA